MNHVAVLASAAPSSALNETMKAAITAGFNTLQATVTDVVGIAVPVAVGIIALTAGVHYALKKVRGVLSYAA